MVKDYTVLDGMINNQASVLKDAYDRGYVHGMADGKDSMASEVVRQSREKYDEGFKEGYTAGSDAVMEHVVKKIVGIEDVQLPEEKETVTKDMILKSLDYIERLLHSGLGKKQSLEYLKKFIESEASGEEKVKN